MNKEELDSLNKIASQQKKKTFKYREKFVVRSTYGIKEAGECCGMGCLYCIYGVVKGSTEITKDLDINDW
jgi:hypothetical protein